MDKTAIEDMFRGSEEIRTAAPNIVEVQGKKYKVRHISMKARCKIKNLESEALLLEREAKGEITLKRAKQINKKLYSLHSKTAAYYLLGNLAFFVPFLWSLTWRWLNTKPSEVTFGINNAGSSNDDVNFFFANWQITKVQLALSTKLVGEGIKQYQERMESVENMLETDALPKKQDNK
jgi:hypothetical protein